MEGDAGPGRDGPGRGCSVPGGGALPALRGAASPWLEEPLAVGVVAAG